MKRRLITISFLASSLLAASLMPSSTLAQDSFGDPEGTVLVTPEGELLDYVPDAGDVVVKLNRKGQKVLIDHYGNIVATEVPAEKYLNRRAARQDNGQLPGVEDLGNTERSASAFADDSDYFPARPEDDAQSLL